MSVVTLIERELFAIFFGGDLRKAQFLAGTGHGDRTFGLRLCDIPQARVLDSANMRALVSRLSVVSLTYGLVSFLLLQTIDFAIYSRKKALFWP